MKFLLIVTILVLTPFLYATEEPCDENRGDQDCIETMIAREAIRQQFPVKLAISIARVESNLKMSARGSKGEIGLFQLMPNVKGNLADTRTNIRIGIEMLKKSQIYCKDMGQAFIICYNQGPTRRPKYPFLHPYYRKVIAGIR